MEIKKLLTGHGSIRDDFDHRIDEIILHYESKTQIALEYISKHPGLHGTDVVLGLKNNNRCSKRSGYSGPFGQKLYVIYQGLAEIEHLVHENRVKRIEDEHGKSRYYAVSELI